MTCDLIIASESAQFGQPETGLGVIPGAGGTQRLTRAVGKAVAMDVILSGRFLSAREALDAGLVARVVAREAWLDEAKRVARDIASKGPVATRLAKEAVDRAYEGGLGLGLEYERRLLYLAFASEDAREGLQSFLREAEPEFKGFEMPNVDKMLQGARDTMSVLWGLRGARANAPAFPGAAPAPNSTTQRKSVGRPARAVRRPRLRGRRRAGRPRAGG